MRVRETYLSVFVLALAGLLLFAEAHAGGGGRHRDRDDDRYERRRHRDSKYWSQQDQDPSQNAQVTTEPQTGIAPVAPAASTTPGQPLPPAAQAQEVPQMENPAPYVPWMPRPEPKPVVVEKITALDKALEATYDQIYAQQAAREVNRMAVGISAGTAVVTCAEGANVVRENEAKGGVLFDHCLRSLDSARYMQESGAEAARNSGTEAPEFSIDKDVVESERADAVLTDLESNYGVSREDVIEAFRLAQGDTGKLSQPGVIESLSKGKLTTEQVRHALEAAGALTPEERERLLAESRVAGLGEEHLYKLASAKGSGSRTKTARSSLMESLSRRPSSTAARKDEVFPRRNFAPAEGPRFSGESLTPLEDPLFTQAERKMEFEELTLFDVVSRKYREKSEALLR